MPRYSNDCQLSAFVINLLWVTSSFDGLYAFLSATLYISYFKFIFTVDNLINYRCQQSDYQMNRIDSLFPRFIFIFVESIMWSWLGN